MVSRAGVTDSRKDLTGDVRSPHNYLVGSYARLGIFGLMILFSLLAVGAWRSVRAIADGNSLRLVCGALYPALLTAAVSGVVFESPFGVIPAFWMIGILSNGGGSSANCNSACRLSAASRGG